MLHNPITIVILLTIILLYSWTISVIYSCFTSEFTPSSYEHLVYMSGWWQQWDPGFLGFGHSPYHSIDSVCFPSYSDIILVISSTPVVCGPVHHCHHFHHAGLESGRRDCQTTSIPRCGRRPGLTMSWDWWRSRCEKELISCGGLVRTWPSIRSVVVRTAHHLISSLLLSTLPGLVISDVQ
jgi:hypothetical protein